MSVVGNDVTVLNAILKKERKKAKLQVQDDEFFERFVFEQELKNFDISEDDLDFGLTGGPGDGGIDGFFFFVDGELLQEDLDEYAKQRTPDLDLFVMQAKNSSGFQDTVLEKFIATSKHIFDLGSSLDTLTSIYNGEIIEKARLFRESYDELQIKHPKLQITYVSACKGNINTINKGYEGRMNQLRNVLKPLFPDAEVHVKNLGARELLVLYHTRKPYSLELKYTKSFSSSEGPDNYVILCDLADYYRFVVDDRDQLRRYLFDANIRAFQGRVEVNKDITDSLENEHELDFWWLNNGITILASNATQTSRKMAIENVQIINGLQTTTCLYNYFSERKSRGKTLVDHKNPKRSILVKILVPDKKDAPDKIIKATNFQTMITPASLKATDAIHYLLEDYFKKHSWYYDRRKNYYKNEGKPQHRIISIPLLAQSMMSLVCKEPHTARARPASLVKNPDTYHKLFGGSISVEVYLFCAQMIKIIELRLKTALTEFTNQEKTNLKFHVAMTIMMKKTGRVDYRLKDVEGLSISDIDEKSIDNTARLVIHLANDFIKKESVSLEKMSKANRFVDYIKSKINKPE